MINESLEIEGFIKNCNERSVKHFKNSLNSRKWKNFLEFASALVGASASLCLPLLAVTNSDALTVAICGNVFVFTNVIISALKQNYNFLTLEYMHGHLSSEFSDLENEFKNFQRKGYNTDELEKIIIKFQGICSRSNIQSVKECHFCFCYN